MQQIKIKYLKYLKIDIYYIQAPHDPMMEQIRGTDNEMKILAIAVKMSAIFIPTSIHSLFLELF